MKKRLRKRSERGQAVSELVISLIGVSLIVLGTIMVSVMGISGIRNLIDTRSEAERKMNANAFGDVQANHITEWVNIRRNDGAGLQFADPGRAQATAFSLRKTIRLSPRRRTAVYSWTR